MMLINHQTSHVYDSAHFKAYKKGKKSDVKKESLSLKVSFLLEKFEFLPWKMFDKGPMYFMMLETTMHGISEKGSAQ